MKADQYQEEESGEKVKKGQSKARVYRLFIHWKPGQSVLGTAIVLREKARLGIGDRGIRRPGIFDEATFIAWQCHHLGRWHLPLRRTDLEHCEAVQRTLVSHGLDVRIIATCSQ